MAREMPYSIGTASREISRATSSRCRLSGLRWLARAEAGIRHHSWREHHQARSKVPRWSGSSRCRASNRATWHTLGFDRLSGRRPGRSPPYMTACLVPRFRRPPAGLRKNLPNPCLAEASRLSFARLSNPRFGPLQARKALLYAPRARTSVRLFLGSSAVEHSTVNRMVAGSNPARGAKQSQQLSSIFRPFFRSGFLGVHTMCTHGSDSHV